MTVLARFHGSPPTYLTLPALQALGLPHASTTRHCPGVAHPAEPVSPIGRETAAALAPCGLDFPRVAYLRQVHGATARRVEAGGNGGEGDVLFTTTPRLPLAIFTADCLSVVVYDRAGGRLALAHVGWRGTVRSASLEAVRVLAAEGARPGDLHAAIFPSIGPCCYEVDRPVIEPLRAAFPDRWEAWVTSARPGKWRLDLWAANEFQLASAGVRADRIANPRLCTGCRTDLFFSYRKEGSRGRLVTVAALP